MACRLQIAIVVRSGQEILLADAAKQFFKKVEFDPGEHGAIRGSPRLAWRHPW